MYLILLRCLSFHHKLICKEVLERSVGEECGGRVLEKRIVEKFRLEFFFFFLLYAAWVRSRAERPSVSYSKVVMEVAWTGHNLQFTKTN